MKIYQPFVVLLAVAIWITASFQFCSSVKKVNKDEHKQLSVIGNYVNNHPYHNDTFYLPGNSDTTLQTVTHVDTAYINRVKTVFKTQNVTKIITDTIYERVIDRSSLDALQKIIVAKNDLAILAASKSAIWRKWSFIATLIGVLSIAVNIKQFFK
jgi:hypothetical protein